MAGFPPRFGTGMSPMGGLQPTNPTPTLPPLQTPAGNTAPPVGAPIPLSTGKTPGVVGYGGSSAGRDNFSKYLQKMNTSAPLALNRGGPVRMSRGGKVFQQQGFLPSMDLSSARRPINSSSSHLGLQGGLGGGGISGALEPLKRYITTQVQQQNNEKIGPFVDGIVQNVEQEFGLQSGGGMTAQPAITQMPSMNRPSLGLGYGNFPMPALNRVPFFGGFDTRITPRGGFDSPFRGRALGYADGGAVPRQTMIEDQPHMLAYIDPEERSMLEQMGGSGQPGPGGVPAYARRDGPGSENFGSEARDFQDELDRIEEEQRQNDADDREAAEAALRAATEQRIAAQYPQPDEIEIMNTAGYDKEPTSYPTAGRDSYAGFGGGQLFSNRGGLEQPFDRTNRQMTNLGSPLSDYINNESAEGTFADSDVIDSIDLSGAKGPAAGAATLPSGLSGGLGDTDADSISSLGQDPVSARNALAKRMKTLNEMEFLRNKLGFPERTDSFSSADEYVNAMKDRLGGIRALPDDVLYPATQEFKSRYISPFDFDRSDPNTRGIMPLSSGSSALTSGPLSGDPFTPLRGASIGGSRQGTPDNLDVTLDNYGTQTSNFSGEVDPGAPVGTFDFPPTDEQITDRGFVPTNIAQPAISVTEVSPPEDVDFMFGTEDLANQTPTPTGFGFDDDEELRDSSVMYSDMSLDKLEQLSLDGDEGASQAIRDRMDAINARELDAFERDRASKGFSTRPATSMSPPRDDVFSTPRDLNRFDFVERGRDLNRANEPFSSLGGTLGEDMSDKIIDEIPYDASFPTEPAVRANIPSDYKTLNQFDLEQLSLDGDEIASNELRSRDDRDNQLSLDKYTVDQFGVGDPIFSENIDPGEGVISTFTSRPTGGSSIEPLSFSPVDPLGIGDPRGIGGAGAINEINEDLYGGEAPFGDPLDPMGIGEPIGSFGAIDEINDDLYEDAKDFEIVPFDLDNIVKDVQTGVFSEGFEFPDEALIKAEKLIAKAEAGNDNTAESVKNSKKKAGDNLYYKVLDNLGKGNYKEETKEELLERLRAGERNQGWVRDAVSMGSKAHPALFLIDTFMIGLVKKDMKEQADLLDGKGLKDGQTAEAVRIQKGRHKGKYVGVVIKDEKGNIVEYKGHKVMPNQFDNKDALYDYILDDTFKPGPDDDDSPVVDDPCPAGYVLSGGVCVPIQSVGEDEEDVVEEDTDDTPEDTAPTETLDEIMARITNPSRNPSNPTETFTPIRFANKGGEMKVDPLAGGAIQDSLASATQRFLNSLTG